MGYIRSMQPFCGFTADFVLDMDNARFIQELSVLNKYIWLAVSAIMHLQYHPGNHYKKF